MKRRTIIFCLAIAAVFCAGTAGADTLAGRFGVTGKLGFLVPADNDAEFMHNSTDTGLVGGGGVIYGIDHNWALLGEITRTSFGSETGDFGTTDLSFGAQYRFMPRERLVPHVGGGLDILINDYSPYFTSSRDVDTTVGVHVDGGVDYFIQRQFALTGELRAVIAPNATITDRSGSHVGNFDPSSFSGTFGVRYFFN